MQPIAITNLTLLIKFGKTSMSDLNTSFTFKIFTQVSDLPEKWNDLTSGNVFLSSDYLKVMEISAPENICCYFIGLYKNQVLTGIALSKFINLSQLHSFGERDKHFKTKIRNFFFRRLSSHVLFIGNNMLTGQNAYRFSKDMPVTQGLRLLHQALVKIESDLLRKGHKTHLTIFKDFSLAETQSFLIPEFKNYYQFSTQPNMVFKIHKNWLTFEDYLSDLIKKYRDQYKRARKKSEGITKRKLSLEEIIAHNSKIYELYFTVAKNAPFNTFYLPQDHFIAFKKALKDQFLFYGYFIGDELVGFNTLIKNGKDIDTYFLGYDKKYQREKMLYLNMLYDMIGFSINKGHQRVIFARTALEIKSSVGAKPIAMFGYIKHSNPVYNYFMPQLFRYFEPEMFWKERNPFKE